MAKNKNPYQPTALGGVAHGDSIVHISPLEMLDSRGQPALEVMIELLNGCKGVASVPSGASTGKHEAVEWRDGDDKRYGGKGLLGAIERIKGDISDLLLGQRVSDQRRLDNLLIQLDGSDHKSVLGANSILATSLAMAHAAANYYHQPLYKYVGGTMANILPVPMMNIINGGAHANNNLSIQEFMIMPIGFPCFKEALRAGVETFHALKALLQKKSLSTAVGDEGGFAPNLSSNQEALSLLNEAVKMAGYQAGKQIFYALDCASSEFFKDGKYHVNNEILSGNDWCEELVGLAGRFPILSIEDGMAEDDLAGWATLTKKLGGKLQLVGDDLFVTNPKRLMMGIEQNLANSILIKPNQIGTLTETNEAVTMAKQYNYRTIMSHRSGETEDCTIADLAVGFGTGQIKTGAPSRTDRTAKYNRLLAIELQLQHGADYFGETLLGQLT